VPRSLASTVHVFSELPLNTSVDQFELSERLADLRSNARNTVQYVGRI
jgi:hypothetical protein